MPLLSYLVFALLIISWAFLLGRATISLQFVPLYPRENYFGNADIAPETENLPLRERVVGLVALGVTAILAGALAAWSSSGLVHISMLAFFVGTIVEMATVWPSLRNDRAVEREQRFRGAYVLYLRAFDKSALWTLLGALVAARTRDVVMVLAPSRRESLSLRWLMFSTLSRPYFAKLKFWTTSNHQWNRVVNSLMYHAAALVFDTRGMMPPGSPRGIGLTIETVMAITHGLRMPVAYIVDEKLAAIMTLPAPAVLHVTSDPLWIWANFWKFTRRLGQVIWNELSAEEMAYLRQHYAALETGYRDAMVRDRNLAAREGRQDPHQQMLSRDPLGTDTN